MPGRTFQSIWSLIRIPIRRSFLSSWLTCAERTRGRGSGKFWAGEEYVFADDRMYDICGLLGAQALYSGDEIPEGFIPIT